jgi:hypothetical protein
VKNDPITPALDKECGRIELFKKELALFRQFSFFSYHGKTTQIDSILLRRSENILNLPTKATQIDCNI